MSGNCAVDPGLSKRLTAELHDRGVGECASSRTTFFSKDGRLSSSETNIEIPRSTQCHSHFLIGVIVLI